MAGLREVHNTHSNLSSLYEDQTLGGTLNGLAVLGGVGESSHGRRLSEGERRL